MNVQNERNGADSYTLHLAPRNSGIGPGKFMPNKNKDPVKAEQEG